MVVKIKDKNLYYVGGVVRDEILGLQSFDTDFCYEGNAIEFAKRECFQIIRENPDFGTVRVLIDNEEVDIASTRTEYYPKNGHLPVVDSIGCSLKDDLKRRDFTINSLAKNTVSGEIIDYFGGIEDIKARKIRVLHQNSFSEDPTRILRALKFSVRFGFDLEDSTKTLQDKYLANINYDVCYHRLKKELKETFNLNSYLAFERFISQGIYKLLGENQNEVVPVTFVQNLVKQYSPSNVWLVYLGTFNLEKFELTKIESEIIKSYCLIKDCLPVSNYDVYKLFQNSPIESILLYAMYVNKDVALKFLNELIKIKVELRGDDLQALGIPQGKMYSEIFEYILEQRVLGKILTKDDEILSVRKRYGC